MALYLVATPDGVRLVRAKNGRRALDLMPGASEVERVHEIGPEGVVGFGASQEAGAPEMKQDGSREVEITQLSDRGVRRFKNLDTGDEREEPREPEPQSKPAKSKPDRKG